VLGAALLTALTLLATPAGALQDAPGTVPQEQAPPPAPPVVVAVRVEGQQRYSADQLREGLGLRVGAPIDPEQIERGIETLWKVFHVKADVSQREVEGGVEVLLSVVELPVDLEPRFVGNVAIKLKQIYEWAGMEEGGELYLYQAARVRQRLVEAYRKEGFYFAEVEEAVRGGDGSADTPPDVIFEIREGPRVRVKAVVIHGDDSMPETGMLFWKGGLKKLAGVELKGWTLFNWWGKKFVRDTLDADLLAMRTVYRERGWLDAVVELDRLEFNEDRSKVTIHVIVDEGARYHVSTLSVRAVDRRRDPATGEWVEDPTALVFPEEELKALCQMQPGRIYEKSRLEADRRKLRDHYGSQGYLSHPSLEGQDSWDFLDPELVFDVDHHTVEVTYKLAQGRQRFIREVLFSGATHTRDRVLRRDVTMLPGERADLTKIQKSLGAITSTGYFSDEMRRLEHHDPTFRFLPTGDPDLVDLEYIVEEGRVVAFQIMGGVSSDNGLFGQVSLSMKNFDLFDLPSSLGSTIPEIYKKQAFHGAGQRLDIDLSPGTQINYYRIHFNEPDLFRTQFKRISLDLEVQKRVRFYDNYDEDRLTYRALVGRRFSPKFSISVGSSIEHLDISNVEAGVGGFVDPDDPPVPPALEAEQGSSDLYGGLFDVRWRDLDNFLNPRQGYNFLWNSAVYGGPFGGDWEFVKSELNAEVYVPVGDPDKEVRPGWHVELRAGVADPYGDTDIVPYSERFFLGGTRTLRGFAYRGVGPNTSADQPLGGETMLGGTFEYRIPIYTVTQPGTYRELEMFRALLFADWGVLDPDPYRLDLQETRASIGFGFGLTHPIPISFNFGFPVRMGDGDQRQTFSFDIAVF
jgi:outer membrane protein insertion porin family